MKVAAVPTVVGTLAPQLRCEVCGNVVSKGLTADAKGSRNVAKEYLKINLSETSAGGGGSGGGGGAGAGTDEVSELLFVTCLFYIYFELFC